MWKSAALAGLIVLGTIGVAIADDHTDGAPTPVFDIPKQTRFLLQGHAKYRTADTGGYATSVAVRLSVRASNRLTVFVDGKRTDKAKGGWSQTTDEIGAGFALAF